MKKLLLVLSIIFLLSGCAQTQLTSFTDPEFEGKTYSNVMILTYFTNIQLRNEVEKAFTNLFISNSCNCSASIDLIPPTREYNADNINKAVFDNHIDSILELNIIDANTNTEHYSTGSYTSGTASTYGNTTYYNAYSTPQSFNVTKTKITYQIKMYDAATGKVAWVASATVNGTDASTKELAKSLAKQVMEKLQQDGLIPIIQK